MALFKVNTIPICKDEIIGAQGTAGTFISDTIDMRDINVQGACSLTYGKAATGAIAGTTGSSLLSYMCSATRDGTFSTAGTFATHGAVEGERITAFTPKLAPFMKIRAVTGTSNPLKLTAELNVR